MTLSKTAIWTALSVAALAAVGCDLVVGERTPRDRIYVQDQPQYVQPQPQPVYVQPQPQYVQPQPVYVQPQPQYIDPEPQYIVVQEAPPPIIVERRPAAPSAAYVWIEGSWNWSNQRYSWEAGRYALPPQPDAVWVGATYIHDGAKVRYTAGQWRRPNPNSGRGNNNGRGDDNGRGNDNGRGRGRGN